MNTELSCAEAVDRFFKRVVWVALLSALIATTEAAEYLVSDSLTVYLGQAAIVIRILLAALILLIVFHSLPKLLRHWKSGYHEPEGFVPEAFKTAGTTSWAVTVLLVAGLESAVTSFAHLPAKFFLEVILAVMFGVFYATFRVVNRDDPGDVDEAGA